MEHVFLSDIDIPGTDDSLKKIKEHPNIQASGLFVQKKTENGLQLPGVRDKLEQEARLLLNKYSIYTIVHRAIPEIDENTFISQYLNIVNPLETTIVLSEKNQKNLKNYLKAVLRLPKSQKTILQSITNTISGYLGSSSTYNDELFTFNESLKALKIFTGLYFRYPNIIFDTQINQYKTNPFGKSSYTDQYGRYLSSYTYRQLILGITMTSNFNQRKKSNKLLSNTELDELIKQQQQLLNNRNELKSQLNQQQQLLNNRNGLNQPRNSSNTVNLREIITEYSRILYQLEEVSTKIFIHYRLSENTGESSHYIDRLDTRFEGTRDYIDYFKKLDGISPLQFSIFAKNYTEEDIIQDSINQRINSSRFTSNPTIRVCCFASALARIILAIDKFKEKEPDAYNALCSKLTFNENHLFDDCERNFDKILRALNVKCTNIKISDTHIISSIQTFTYKILNQLNLTNPFNDYDGIKIEEL